VATALLLLLAVSAAGLVAGCLASIVIAAPGDHIMRVRSAVPRAHFSKSLLQTRAFLLEEFRGCLPIVLGLNSAISILAQVHSKCGLSGFVGSILPSFFPSFLLFLPWTRQTRPESCAMLSSPAATVYWQFDDRQHIARTLAVARFC